MAFRDRIVDDSYRYGETSQFREVLEFFERIGVYDVLLPFLLVFTIVFAIFEKTKVLGTEKIEGVETTKKNLNAMVAFVISFMVVASSRLVQTITEVSSNMVILLFLAVFFLLLVGSFYKEGEMVALEGPWKTLFMFIMFIGIVAIFLWGIKTEDGEPWLEFVLEYIVDNFDSTAVGSIVLVVIIILFMWYIVREPKGSDHKKPTSTHSSNKH
ncbi:MAG: hypothetical protein QF632_00995 [Candidatus Woesearchaeota archaeon]|jgi:hypothetical protein|nr:hypothetical protein [Candidatus Woesearchaeota archaeon]MDP7323318.1 hypothetical protein [Candidatus Woesearchaeota archaeon]MDP7458502.1 hypothetical protein [Candidatus Woesearchaeota archaeon]